MCPTRARAFFVYTHIFQRLLQLGFQNTERRVKVRTRSQRELCSQKDFLFFEMNPFLTSYRVFKNALTPKGENTPPPIEILSKFLGLLKVDFCKLVFFNHRDKITLSKKLKKRTKTRDYSSPLTTTCFSKKNLSVNTNFSSINNGFAKHGAFVASQVGDSFGSPFVWQTYCCVTRMGKADS